MEKTKIRVLVLCLGVMLKHQLYSQESRGKTTDLVLFKINLPENTTFQKQTNKVGSISYGNETIFFFCGEKAPEFISHELHNCRAAFLVDNKTLISKKDSLNILYGVKKDSSKFDMNCFGEYLKKNKGRVDTLNNNVFIVFRSDWGDKNDKTKSTLQILVIDLTTKKKVAFFTNSKELTIKVVKLFSQMTRTIKFY